jgi:hypothetical protein
MIEKVEEKTLGIIWVTKEMLSQKLVAFDDLNYLSNNLLIKNVKNFHPTKNFYLTSAFGKPFYIAHLTEGAKLKEDLVNILEITKDIVEPGMEVLILSEDTKIADYLAKKNSALTFVHQTLHD